MGKKDGEIFTFQVHNSQLVDPEIFSNSQRSSESQRLTQGLLLAFGPKSQTEFVLDHLHTQQKKFPGITPQNK